MKLPFYFLLLSLFVGAIFISVPAYGGSKVIKVLSYNVKGLPTSGRRKRFKRIAEIIEERRVNGTAPDIILFQEVFLKSSKHVFRGTGYRNVYKGPKAFFLFGKIFSGGLYNVTDHKILKKKRKSFKGKCTSWDCFANKGVAFTRIEIDGLPFPIEVLNTHMQSSNRANKRKASRSRKKQVEVIQKFVKKHLNPELPVIFAGDFNLKPLDPERPHYTKLLDIENLKNSGRACLDLPYTCVVDPGTPLVSVWHQTVDHHFFRGTDSIKIEPIYVSRNFTEHIEGVGALSDHLGYEVHYKITWED